MLIFLIGTGSVDFLTLLNGGVTPEIEEPRTYLVVEPGEPNRIISDDEFQLLKKQTHVQTTVRKFHYA